MGKESKIEEIFVREVYKEKGYALKFWPFSISGFPDRIALFPKARIYFVELKAPGKKPADLQSLWHRKLTRLGFQVFVISSREQINSFIQMVKNDI